MANVQPEEAKECRVRQEWTLGTHTEMLNLVKITDSQININLWYINTNKLIMYY